MGWIERPEFGANVGLIDEIYRQYLDNPESVSPAWRDFFAENEPEGYEDPRAAEATAEGRVEAEGGQPAKEQAAPPTPQEAPPAKEATPKEPRAAAAKAKEEPKPKAAPERDGRAEPQLVPLRGAAARIVEAMEASREVPTATSVRTVPARLLEVNRSVLNGHLRRRQGGKQREPRDRYSRPKGPAKISCHIA